MPSPVIILAVAIGGALGALSRVALSDLFGQDPLHLVTLSVTLVINTVGAGLLGFLHRHSAALHPAWRSGLGVGFLGSFTTWSAVIVAVALLGGVGNYPLALGYLLATLALGVLAALVGLGPHRRQSS